MCKNAYVKLQTKESIYRFIVDHQGCLLNGEIVIRCEGHGELEDRTSINQIKCPFFDRLKRTGCRPSEITEIAINKLEKIEIKRKLAFLENL